MVKQRSTLTPPRGEGGDSERTMQKKGVLGSLWDQAGIQDIRQTVTEVGFPATFSKQILY